MAKTIKFNLICDGNPVRTIEDLRNNFSIEDILNYYDNKLLHRWLEVRGYDKELKNVMMISCKDSLDIIKELINIFEVSSDTNKVEEEVYILKYLEERRELYSIYKEEETETKEIIDDYFVGYHKLAADIWDNPTDIALIKANIEEIATNYSWLLELDHRSLFHSLYPKSSLAIMCLLMNENTRNYYLPVEIEKEDGTKVLDIATSNDKNTMFNMICTLIKRPDLDKILGENLVTYAGKTDEYWKDLEPAGKKYMIINMGAGDFVRSAGKSGGDMANVDISNKFVILDGIDYKSNSDIRKLQYMEV